MRHAYPLLWCLPEGTQAKLLGQISDISAVPRELWSEWEPKGESSQSPIHQSVGAGVDYDKFIRQSPSRSRGHV